MGSWDMEAIAGPQSSEEERNLVSRLTVVRHRSLGLPKTSARISGVDVKWGVQDTQALNTLGDTLGGGPKQELHDVPEALYPIFPLQLAGLISACSNHSSGSTG
jgi:hypothetical protein